MKDIIPLRQKNCRIKSKFQGGTIMRATFYTDEQLVKSVRQLEKDWKRLYPDGNTDNPLYEGLQYERYLCKKRGLVS